MPMQLDTSKICFITNVSQEKQYENCVSYIRRLTVPVGMTVEFRAIRDAKSMCEGYARAQSSSDAKYKIYLHQDVMITDENFLYTLISTFQSNASYGIAGLVGVYNLPQNAVWWTSFDRNKVGVTIDTVYPEGEAPHRRKLQFTIFDTPTEVAALDGFLLATQYDLPWRADIFHGFHFYDIAQCFEFRRRGLKAIVLPLIDPVTEHWNERRTTFAPYSAEQLHFIPEYASDRWGVHPSVLSIILLASDDPKLLFIQIQRIKKLFDGRRCELIVTSPSPTNKLRASLKENGIRSILPEDKSNIAECINKAIKASIGKKILLLEDSTLFAPTSFQSMFAALPHDIPALIGPLANAGWFTSISQALKISAPCDYQDYTAYCAFAKDWAAGSYGKHRVRKTLIVDAGAVLFNRKAVETVGLLDTAFGNDNNRLIWDYCLRIYQKSGAVFLAEASYIHRNGNNVRPSKDETIWERKWGFSSTYSCNSRMDLIKCIDFNKKPHTFLEAGCACGPNFIEMKNHVPDIECAGIELNEHSAAIARLFADVYAMDLEKFKRPDWHDKFDIIMMGDILEHLNNPWQAVRNMFRSQSPGGEILISVPNIMHFSIFNRMLHGDWKYEDQGILDRTHLRFFTKKTAQELLEQAGYRIKSIDYIHFSNLEGQMQAFIKELKTLLPAEIGDEQILAAQWLIIGEKPAKQ